MSETTDRIAAIEAAPDAEERVRVARAIFDAFPGNTWPDDGLWNHSHAGRESCLRLADAALSVRLTAADDTAARVEDVARRLDSIAIASGQAGQVAYTHAAVMVRAALAQPAAPTDEATA